MTQAEHPCLEPAYSDDSDEPVDPRHLASELGTLRELTAALLDEAGVCRQHAEGAYDSLVARLSRIELRAPGEGRIATVDDIQAYTQYTAGMVGAVQDTHRRLEEKVRRMEASIRVLSMHVAAICPPDLPSRLPELHTAVSSAISSVEAMLATRTPPELGPDSSGPPSAADRPPTRDA